MPPDAPARRLATMLGYLARDMRQRNQARIIVPFVRGPRLERFDRFSVEDVELAQLDAERRARNAEDTVLLPPVERRFVCFFNFLGWWHWSLGIHLDVRHPHIGLHVPFGFVRFGWCRSPTIDSPRAFGYNGWETEAR